MRLVTPLVLASLMFAALPSQAQNEPSDQNADEPLVFVQSPAQARAVCLAARPSSQVWFDGDETETKAARKAYEARRKKAYKVLYRLRLPAEGFEFGAYDNWNKGLPVDVSKGFRASYGAVTVDVPRATRLLLPLSATAAKAAQSARNARSASLELSFVLDSSAAAACTGSSSVDVYTLHGKAVAAVLFDGVGDEIERAETPLADSYRSLLGGYSGVPTVRWSLIEGAETMLPDRLEFSVQASIKQMRGCYESMLKLHPGGVGEMGMVIAVNATGAVDEVNIVADSISKPSLAACVQDQVMKLQFDEGGGLVTAHIEFRLIPGR